MKTILLVSAVILITGLTRTAAQSCSANFKLYYFSVTATPSPNTPSSLQNAMSFIAAKGQIGHISQDFENNPGALNRPHLLRASDIIISDGAYLIWDATNNPTGPFANERGKRAAWGVDVTDTNAFLASSVYFQLWSSDAANTFSYAGNIATNTANGAPIAFNTTLQGELWNADGSITSYSSGEDVATHPINRLMALPRLGYLCQTPETLRLTLDYFQRKMPLTNFAAFYVKNAAGEITCGLTNSITSLPYIRNFPGGRLTFEGQRHLGVDYDLLKIPDLNQRNIYETTATGMKDGQSIYDLNWNANGAHPTYQMRERFAAATEKKGSLVHATPPALIVTNGEE